jgi:paraquat-inducible protein A
MCEPHPTPCLLELEQITACPGCDLLLENIEPAPGEKLCCPRCGEILKNPKKDSINRTLALSLTGLLLFPFAVFEPIMTLNAMGMQNSGNIFECVISTWKSGYMFVAVMVALSSIIFPLVKLILLAMVSLYLKLGRSSRYLPLMMRLYIHLDEWGMLEVYMIGLLVTIIKIGHMAKIQYDIGFFCFVGLLLMALGSSIMMDEEEFWKRIEDVSD